MSSQSVVLLAILGVVLFERHSCSVALGNADFESSPSASSASVLTARLEEAKRDVEEAEECLAPEEEEDEHNREAVRPELQCGVRARVTRALSQQASAGCPILRQLAIIRRTKAELMEYLLMVNQIAQDDA